MTTTTRTDVYLRRGWHLSAVDSLARQVAGSHRHWGTVIDLRDAYHEAHSEIVAEVYHPDFDDDDELDPTIAWRSAMRAVAKFKADTTKVHGKDYEEGRRGANVFWNQRMVTPSPENRVVEELALHQVWAALTDTDRATLTAWSLSRTHQDAADRTGIARGAYKSRLYSAKQEAKKLWFDHETPPAITSNDRKGETVDNQRHADWRLQNRQRAAQGGRKRRPQAPCGTVSAYNRHVRDRETPCRLCKDARAEYQRVRRTAEREQQVAS